MYFTTIFKIRQKIVEFLTIWCIIFIVTFKFFWYYYVTKRTEKGMVV